MNMNKNSAMMMGRVRLKSNREVFSIFTTNKERGEDEGGGGCEGLGAWSNRVTRRVSLIFSSLIGSLIEEKCSHRKISGFF
jgi:hypothetical protein